MGAGSRHGCSDRGASTWRRPRWPDGRLISPLDDGIQRWVRVIALASGIVGFWLYGQSGRPVSATLPYAGLVLVLLLTAAVCCWLVSNTRLWALAGATSPAVASATPRFATAPVSQRLWRPARWPDGRYVGGGDGIAGALRWLGVSLLIAADWVFGSMDVAGIDVGERWASVIVLVFSPVWLLAFVSNRRIVALAKSAAAEGSEWQAPSE